MNLFYLVLCLIVLLLVIATLALFGDLPASRNTVLQKLYLYVTIDLFMSLTKFFRWIDLFFFNGMFTSFESSKKLRWVSGWIIPVFYLTILTMSLNMFYKHTFQQIKTLGGSTLIHYFLITPTILTNYTSFLLAVLSDPGYIDSATVFPNNRLNVKFKFPHDELIYASYQECRSCKSEKIPRSKHCSSCNRCVLMFDHHCIWLNNDIGYYTFRWFFLFLVSICAIFTYGAYLCFYSMQLYLKKSPFVPAEILQLSFLSKYWKVIKHTTITNEVSGILFILCILLLPIVGLFLGQILHSVYLGVTTNEMAKWDYIDDLIQNHLMYKFFPEVGDSVFLILSDEGINGSLRFIELRSGRPFNSMIGGELKEIKGWTELENVYDKGFLNNFLERVFPSSL